jgi:hypothetical protein
MTDVALFAVFAALYTIGHVAELALSVRACRDEECLTCERARRRAQ